jgi:hypothetical protein
MVDVSMAEEAMAALQSGSISPEQLKEKYGQGSIILGRFHVPVREEEPIIESYPMPGTQLHATATAVFTDEIPTPAGRDQLFLTLAASKTPQENAGDEEDHAATNVTLSEKTHARLSKRMKIDGRVLSLSLICNFDVAGKPE